MLIWNVVLRNYSLLVTVIKHRVAAQRLALEHVANRTGMLLLDVVVGSQAIEIGILYQFAIKEELFGQVFKSRIDGNLVDLMQVRRQDEVFQKQKVLLFFVLQSLGCR